MIVATPHSRVSCRTLSIGNPYGGLESRTLLALRQRLGLRPANWCIAFLTRRRRSRSTSEARTFAESVLPRSRYIFVGKAEAETVFGLQGDSEEVLNGLSRRNPKATIALLQGGEGSTVLDSGRFWRPTVRHAVQMIDPIGAGDAYAAGFLWASLNGRHPQDAVNIAATVAALKCSMWGDVALINPKDVEDALGGGADVRR